MASGLELDTKSEIKADGPGVAPRAGTNSLVLSLEIVSQPQHQHIGLDSSLMWELSAVSDVYQHCRSLTNKYCQHQH